MNTNTDQSQQAKAQALLRVCEDLHELRDRYANRLVEAEKNAKESDIATQLSPEELRIVEVAEIPAASFLATKRLQEYEEAVKAGLTPDEVSDAEEQGIPYSVFRGLVEINARLDALGLSEAAKTCLHVIVSTGAPVDVADFFGEGEE